MLVVKNPRRWIYRRTFAGFRVGRTLSRNLNKYGLDDFETWRKDFDKYVFGNKLGAYSYMPEPYPLYARAVVRFANELRSIESTAETIPRRQELCSSIVGVFVERLRVLEPDNPEIYLIGKVLNQLYLAFAGNEAMKSFSHFFSPLLVNGESNSFLFIDIFINILTLK